MKNKQFYLTILLIILWQFTSAQPTDSLKNIHHFSGTISATNNGISFIPTFSLGKPATIFNLSIGNKKLSFEPEFRFALEGKPWSFLFWWRYKLINNRKFRFTLGGHPALSFKTITVTNNGVSSSMIQAQRYLAGELAPNYLLAKNMSVGVYYLYSRGLETDATRNTHFLTLNSSISNIKLSDNFYMKFTPQLYYLRMDNKDGMYFTSALTLANRKCPIVITGVINKIIKTNITASQNFVWNISLAYSFNYFYTRK